MKIFVVFKAAKDLFGEFIRVTLEAAFNTQQEAQQYFVGRPVIWEENVNSSECQCERGIHQVSVEGRLIYTVFRVDKEITTEFVSLATEAAFLTKEEAEKSITEISWKEKISDFDCECQRDYFEIELN